MLEFIASPQAFLVPLLQIIGIDIVLSGDNAVVIALASRSLPPEQQKKAVLWGTCAAVTMRIVLTLTAVALLDMPYLKLIGSGFLLWIGIQLLNPDEDDGEGNIKSSDNLTAAIRTILMADLVMSLDNVLGIAAAAKGNFLLLIIGLGISIPLVVFGAKMLLRLMERFPLIVTIGAALLGYVSGEMAVTDPAVKDWVRLNFHALHEIVPFCGAGLVLIAGKLLSSRRA